MTSDAAGQPAPSGRAGDFARFWFGEAVSLLGAQVTLLALPLTAVLEFAVSPVQVGVLRGLELAPFLLLAMPFGLLVDRSRKRPLMIAANLVRAVAIGVVPLLVLLDRLHLGVLFVVAAVVGVATVLFDVCWMSYIPILVSDRARLMDANGKLAATNAAADIAGPGLAGVLVQLLSAPVTLVVNTASYLVSVVSLLLIRTPEPVPQRTGERHLWPELVEGMRFVFTDPILRTVAVLGASYNFFAAFVQAVYLVYAIQVLHLGPGLLGLTLSLGGVGGLLGAVAAGPLTKRFRLGRLYAVAAAVAYVAPILIPLAGGGMPVAVVLLCLAWFTGYAGAGVYNVVALSLRQTITPPHLMGRMNAAMRTLLYGLAAIGAPVGGFLAVQLGMRPALAIGVTLSWLTLAVLFRSPVPRLRALPEPAVSP